MINREYFRVLGQDFRAAERGETDWSGDMDTYIDLVGRTEKVIPIGEFNTCGTTMCIAGRAVVRWANPTDLLIFDFSRHVHVCMIGRYGVNVTMRDAAIALLGLTSQQAAIMYVDYWRKDLVAHYRRNPAAGMAMVCEYIADGVDPTELLST